MPTEEFTFTTTTVIDYDVMKSLLGLTENDAYTIGYTVPVQARKHRKKRINKKWLKKYGYRMVPKELGGFVLNGNSDGTWTFTKEIV